MKKNSFLKDLARNTAIFLGAGELSGKKDQKQKELDDMYDDLDKTMDKYAKETKEEIKKMSPEKQKRLAKLAKSTPWK